MSLLVNNGLPMWLSGKESACQCRSYRRLRLDPWVGKIPWRKKWPSTWVFLPGKSHWQRSVEGYSQPMGSHIVRHDWPTEQQYLVNNFLQDCLISQVEGKTWLCMNLWFRYFSYCSAFSSVQFSRSVVSDSLQPHELQHARPPCPSSAPGVQPNSGPLSRWCHPAISSSVSRPILLLPSIFPSIRVFSNESTLCMRWAKYWSFSFNISPSKEHPGLMSFRMDWLDLLAVQGTLKSLLQHHSSKGSILLCSAFLIVQLSHPYMTTEAKMLYLDLFL